MTDVFVHIPKTAGTTLNRIVGRNYPKKASYTVHGVEVHADINRLCQLPPEQQAKLRLVQGHGTMGLHHAWATPIRYFTMLRHPVERVVSDYYFLLRTPHHFAYHKIVDNQLTLAQYIEQPINKTIDNGQVRVLSGAGTDVPFGGVTTAMLEKAQSNLENLILAFGITERFDESILLLRQAFSWRMPFYINHNVNPHRPHSDSLDTEVLNLIAKKNEMDLALYQFASNLFTNRVNKILASPHILRRFRQQNDWFNRIYPLYRNVRHRMAQLIKG